MKKLLYPLFLFSIIFISCSGEEELKLEAYNPEVFTFDLGEEYEVNATVRFKGFKLREAGEEFAASVAYELDLVKPDGQIEKGLVSKVEDFVFSEKVADAGLDIQFNLDSTYSSGKYSLVFNLRDNLAENTAQASADFAIEE